MDKMEHAEIEKELIGKTITGVIFDPDCTHPNCNDTESLTIDNTDIFICLSDGSKIKCWNSEWGGIGFIKGV